MEVMGLGLGHVGTAMSRPDCFLRGEGVTVVLTLVLPAGRGSLGHSAGAGVAREEVW